MRVMKTSRSAKALIGSAALSLLAGCSGGQFASGDSPIAGLRLGQEDQVEIKGNAPGSTDKNDETSDVKTEGKTEGKDPDDGTTTGGGDLPPPSNPGTTPPTTVVVPVYPSPKCVAEAPNTVVRFDGALEYTSADFKPGVYGEASATKGLEWPNGGTNKKFGVGPAIVDWRLCDKIGFVERGHSLTRTISFRSLDKDGAVALTVHRHRGAKESFGVGIWYHWASNIAWKDNKRLFNFNLHKDYVVSCNYTKATDKWLCGFEVLPPTALDCSPYQSKGCTKFGLKN